MRFRGEVWRQRLWIWVPALLFFLANIAGFAVYYFGYAGGVRSLESTLDSQEQRLRGLENQKQELQTQLTRVSTNERQVRQLYSERLPPRSQALVRVNAEVRTLASQAGLEYRSISFPEDDIDEYGLIERSFVVSVEGTYPELRRFLNLLEVSRSFLTVREIKVAGNAADEGPELRIDITLTTLFSREAGGREPQGAAAAAARTGAGGAR
jgi:Tfp pilus assembly protein PilO